MASLLPTRWENGFNTELLAPLTNLRREMEKLFDQFTDGFPSAEADQSALSAKSFTPRMNIAESENALELTAELPGLTSQDVDVSLSGNILTIKGERLTQKEDTKKNFQLVERHFGSFYRSLKLPFEADPAKVSATCKDGILTVTVPKTAESKARSQRIKVQ